MTIPLRKQPWNPGATVNAQQAADLLGVSHTVIRNLCEEGQLRWFKRTRRVKAHYVIVRDSVIELAAKWERQAKGEDIPR